MEDDHATAEHDSQYVELAVEVFAMLADATRVRIILALRENERSVTELAGLVDKTPTAVSQHLAKLRLARMVTTRHDGTRVYYRLIDEHARQLVTDAIYQAEHSVDSSPRHHRAPHMAEMETSAKLARTEQETTTLSRT
ncbi:MULTISPECIES: ArsR/SmtB family transcription factor [unclassified Rathayibacter]|uniref:ArsR/SmtB family transcription factor n=1 Tax=unclassified Rathayibacter TaxID=2609250 RepID=UPI00188C9C80|nr:MULTISPECIES: metalloregulator ArsR/SmtB family transcription factor [unclassified Rathayibacter]MBF4461949.1 helix-turn-helix transcriptional regulator [Rathayibacter sp. VKM Ac-2879]MBF4504008.1 helix-turn-helix transcriptional regulator [Rathayibacter sp. VKM Ac-2878]